jgi:hypothetical protein
MPSNGSLPYLDTSMDHFDPEKVVRLELERGKDSKFIIEKVVEKEADKSKTEKDKKPAEKEKKDKKDKKEPASQWKLVAPTDIKDRGVSDVALLGLLHTLANVKVEKWVTRIDPKSKDFDKLAAPFGLAPAEIVATVTVKKEPDKKAADKKEPDKKEGDKKDADKKDASKKDDKKKDEEQTETWVYRFGREGSVGKTEGIYALQNKIDLVFLTQGASVKELREAELRDRTVFNFDATKVKQVKMSGWFDKGKFIFKLALERKGPETWTVAEPPKLELRDIVFNDFLRTLSDLKAMRYVQVKGKLLPEYKLGKDEPAVNIEMKLEDGRELKTLTLAIGALDKEGTGYYAMASTLPDVVFLLPKGPFEPVVRDYGYFSRTKAAEKK